MAPVVARPIRRDGRVHFDTSVYYFDFLFAAQIPSGISLDNADGGGMDLYCLYLNLQGSLELRAGSQRWRSAPGLACMADLTTCSRKVFSEHTDLTTIGIARSEAAEYLSAIIERPVREALDFDPLVDLTRGVGPTIAAIAATLRAGFAGDAPLLRSPIALKQMKEATIALLLENVPHRFSDELRRPASGVSPYYVKRAIEFMWANASRPISAAEIAAACGVGVRALNAGFQRFKQAPPMTYLREIRLTGARRDLQNPLSTASITDIALKWGFAHLGRFSARYSKRFGELPSTTARQALLRR